MHYLGLKHKQERQKKKNQKTGYLAFLDKLTWTAGIIGPFTVVPQIYTIYSSRSATGVSLTTWALIFVSTFPWILYGIAHKDKTIMVSFTMWEVVNMGVIVGVILYG